MISDAELIRKQDTCNTKFQPTFDCLRAVASNHLFHLVLGRCGGLHDA